MDPGKMQNRLHAGVPEQAAQQGLIANVAAHEGGGVGLRRRRDRSTGRRARRRCGPRQKLKRHMAADVARSTGHKRTHAVDPIGVLRGLAAASIFLSRAGCATVSARRSAHTLPEIELTSMNKSRKSIRKAVLPVAGLRNPVFAGDQGPAEGTLTVVDRPIIQHVVEEARSADIEHFIFVTGRNKGAIEDHFDSQYEVERTLEERGKTQELAALRR